jgi:hypothetical protein
MTLETLSLVRLRLRALVQPVVLSLSRSSRKVSCLTEMGNRE